MSISSRGDLDPKLAPGLKVTVNYLRDADRMRLVSSSFQCSIHSTMLTLMEYVKRAINQQEVCAQVVFNNFENGLPLNWN